MAYTLEMGTHASVNTNATTYRYLAFQNVTVGPANLKSYNTNLSANIKSIDTNLIANIKSFDTNI